MEGIKRSVAAALAALVLGCGGATEPDVEFDATVLSTPTELALRYGEEKHVGAMRVVFARVVEDSRCPIDAICVWEGNATVELGLAIGSGPTFPLQLSTALEPRSAVWQDVRFTLLEVHPAWRAEEQKRPEDYSVLLRLESAR